MARYTIISHDGETLGIAYDSATAAMWVAPLGPGAAVKVGAKVVWTEGVDGQAGESYDAAAEQIDANAVNR